ncbi:mucolipin-3-like [Agrilus planipennis]|uniref:Mucolipin-3-like n=1 Tax=Agrilus planipennis TaxID=224129 RepID=A0A1W4WYY9_AGRPL|nr:mucolipin-3-like [Agrilus planipennis]
MDAVITRHRDHLCEDNVEEEGTAEVTSFQTSNDNDLRSPLLSEERMRRRLKFYFMNPIEKWHAKRRFPYKFAVQVIKIILVTIQIWLFAYSRYNHVNYTWDNRITFSHLFLKGWDSTREINVYPPAAGPLAVYKKHEFFEVIDYALEGYINLNESIGPYSYPNEDNSLAEMKLCLYHFKTGIIYGFNESYIFDSQVEESCYNISHDSSKGAFKSEKYFEKANITFSALVRAELLFSVKTVNFKAAGPITPPDCYQFDITIEFDNEDHDGQMVLSLDAEPIRLQSERFGELRNLK